MIIGNPHANCCIYLPNVPSLPTAWHWQQADAMQQLLESNTNHWRKIWVISAKILNENQDWRVFLHRSLLHQCCFYCNEATHHPTATLQFYSGQAIAERLTGESLLANLKQHIIQDSHGRWHLPYFDYRQFPNVLIDELRQQLKKCRD